MTGLERLAIEVVAGLFLVWGTVLYLEHRGAAACRAADAVAVAKQQGHNEEKAATDAQAINREASDYAKVRAAPDPIDVPHVGLCYFKAAAVPKAPAARPIAHAAPPSASPDPVSPATDLGPPLVKIGVDADAQVLALQRYITEVCLAN